MRGSVTASSILTSTFTLQLISLGMPVLYDAHGMRSTVFTRMVGIGIRMVFEEKKASENEKIITVSQKKHLK